MAALVGGRSSSPSCHATKQLKPRPEILNGRAGEDREAAPAGFFIQREKRVASRASPPPPQRETSTGTNTIATTSGARREKATGSDSYWRMRCWARGGDAYLIPM